MNLVFVDLEKNTNIAVVRYNIKKISAVSINTIDAIIN